MASESCPICGEEADAEEIDPHNHFSNDDEGGDDGDVVHLLILGSREDKTACGGHSDGDSGGASTDEGSVNCPKCRAVM